MGTVSFYLGLVEDTPRPFRLMFVGNGTGSATLETLYAACFHERLMKALEIFRLGIN